jgi:hypothetical protein
MQRQEFVELRGSLDPQSALRRASLLARVQEAGSSGSRKRPVALVSNRVISLVNADDSYAYRVTASTPELGHLISEIVNHAIDLLNHRLRQYLNFDPDLDGRYRTTRHQISRIFDGCLTGNDLPKRSIATPGRHPAPPVLNI